MPLTLEHVFYTYPAGTKALRDLSFSVMPGEFVGLMGSTGCGKSTLLQIAAGILSPSSGTVRTDGVTGMVFQNPDHQLFETTLEREIAFAPKCQKCSAEEVRRRVTEALRAVGLDDPETRQRSPFTLSGGEKRRAVLAGVLAMEAKYLLLDEPLAGLDAEGTEIMLQCLKERQRNGTAILMAAHDPDIICEYADRVIRMADGEIVLNCPVREAFSLKNNPGTALPELGHVRECVVRLNAAGFNLSAEIATFAELSAAIREALERRAKHE